MNKFLLRYAAKNDILDRYNGVMHRRGYKCSSNAHIAVIVKEDYPAEFEGKILTREGVLKNSSIYFMSIIPQREPLKSVALNFEDFKKIYKQYTEDKKATPRNLRPRFYAVQIEGARFNIEFFKLFVDGAKKFCSANISYYGEYKPIAVANNENYCILMPFNPGIPDCDMKIYQMNH